MFIPTVAIEADHELVHIIWGRAISILPEAKILSDSYFLLAQFGNFSLKTDWISVECRFLQNYHWTASFLLFFVEFVYLIYFSDIKKKMQDTGFFENWTLQGLLNEMDTIERFESPEYGSMIG